MSVDPADVDFPDAPRSELERTIEELIEHAQRVLTTQGRLRSLVRANSLVVEDLDLPQVLRRIATAAIELVDAEYGALGVIGSDGRLEQFIHVGMPDDEAALIGHLPEGHGLLGAVVDSAESIRIAHIEADERSAGFPAHHPAMDSFLGVPIRVRDEVFGNLYLTNRRGGRFTAEDEELVTALAATAGVAIANARLFEESDRRRRWSAALAEVTSALLSGSSDVLAVIADRAGSVVEADLVCVIVPAHEAGMLRVSLARGTDAESLEGREYAAEGTLAGRALSEGGIAAAEVETRPAGDGRPFLGPSIALPLTAAGETLGVLSLSRRPGAPRFSSNDLDMAAEFAAQAGVAIELGRAREDRQRLELVGERSRIARDLHDHVIQRLFAAGLGLQSLAGAHPGQSADLMRHVDAIDAAIADIRTAVFTLSSTSRTTTRHRILDVAAELEPSLGHQPRVAFVGAVDLAVSGALADDVLAVVREGLSNVARHADARETTVEVVADDRTVRVVIEDDGRGLPDTQDRRSGTANLRERAEGYRGRFILEGRPDGGTRLEWTASTEGVGS